MAALFGAVGGWLVVVVSNALGMSPPLVPWTAPIGLILITALVGFLAYTTHQRIQVRRERVEPERAGSLLEEHGGQVRAAVEAATGVAPR